jgi:hypothetical protein
VSSVHSGACDATHAAIVKPGTPDRFASTCPASDAARPGMDKAELEIGFGDFEHLAASLFGPDSPQLEDPARANDFLRL